MGNQEELFGIKIDSVCMEQAVDRVQGWVEASDVPVEGECKYVVTPNVDHTVLLSENELLQAAYSDASLILADGHPIVCLLYTSPSPRDQRGSRMPSSA